jgi:hypothetical protein
MDPIHRSVNMLATGVWIGILGILRPSARKISSKQPANWLPPFRTSARAPLSWWASRRNR